ncbi:MAG: hypothetical protein WBM32_12175 [Crocosphaera sp.]|jgi:hypothetical protein
MKNTQPSEPNQNLQDDLLPEYNFDYSKARPNRFARQENGANITVIKENNNNEDL